MKGLSATPVIIKRQIMCCFVLKHATLDVQGKFTNFFYINIFLFRLSLSQAAREAWKC